MFTNPGEIFGSYPVSARSPFGLSLLHANLHSSPVVSGSSFRFPFIAKAVGRYAHPSCRQSRQSGCYASRLWPLAGLRFLFLRIPPARGERDAF
jgi:hypothetical protein